MQAAYGLHIISEALSTCLTTFYAEITCFFSCMHTANEMSLALSRAYCPVPLLRFLPFGTLNRTHFYALDSQHTKHSTVSGGISQYVLPEVCARVWVNANHAVVRLGGWWGIEEAGIWVLSILIFTGGRVGREIVGSFVHRKEARDINFPLFD